MPTENEGVVALPEAGVPADQGLASSLFKRERNVAGRDRTLEALLQADGFQDGGHGITA